MSTPVRLIPLQCSNCQSAIPAQPGEVAWVCATCGQAMLLDETIGVKAIDVFFSASILPNSYGRPYWVARGAISALNRQTFRGNETKTMLDYWAPGRLFYVPAWKLTVDEMVNEGVRLLQKPVTIVPGKQTAFHAVTVSPRDVRPLAEFIVMSVEAARKDALKELQFQIQLDPAQLWVLP